MNIISWNARDLGKSKGRRLVKEILIEHHIDIVSIQETKKKDFKENIKTYERYYYQLVYPSFY